MTVGTNPFGGPWNDTTIDRWSPTACPVAHYSAGPDPRTPGELEPTIEAHPARGPIVAATLDGVLHLAHLRPDGAGVATETFSISGVLTPVSPVSYDPAVTKTTSNGYGTLAQAGWSDQYTIAHDRVAGPLALVRHGDELVLLMGAKDGSVRMAIGRYRSDEAVAHPEA